MSVYRYGDLAILVGSLITSTEALDIVVGVEGGAGASSSIDDTVRWARDYLGDDVIVKPNKAGDKIFVNQENTRRIRFDLIDSHGDSPHMHIEQKLGDKWIDATPEHRIYPRD